VPVPAKASVYPDKLIADAAAGDVFSLDPFYEKLRQEGVIVVDLRPLFFRLREREKVYCEQDSHWTPAACRAAAEAICALPVVSQLFSAATPEPRPGTELTISGDLAEVLPAAVSGREVITVYPAAAQPVPAADDSPVLLIGDSHTVVFSAAAGTIRHHATGAGVRDHIQARLGFPLAVFTNASSGADAARALVARKAKDNPAFWKGRKLVIWCFAERELTKGPWRRIPAQP
jgi:alginate O-acetyltransferase complex protein AlgJ